MAPAIPDYTAVGTASPSGRMSIPRASGRAPVAEALGDAGTALGQIVEKKYKREADLAYATAKSEYIRGQIDLESQAETAPDYKTWQSTFDTNSRKLRTDIGAKLADPNARAQFEMEADIDAARISAGLAKKAQGRFRETQRAGVDQLADDNRTALLTTNDEVARSSLMTATNEAIDAAVARGVYSPEEAVTKKRTFVENYAKGRADTLDPASRYKALSAGLSRDENGQAKFAKTGTWVDFIRADERLKMIEGAEVDQRQQQILAQQQQDIANREIENGFLDKLQANKLTWSEIRASPLSPEKKEHYLEKIKQVNSGTEWPTNKTLFVSLWDRVHLPDGDPRKITDEDQLQQFVRPGQLSVDQHNQLRGEVQGRRSSEGSIDSELKRGLVTVAKSKLTGTDPLLKLRDPKGDENLQRWLAQFLPAWDKAIKAGKSPQALSDPDSPEYLGRGIDALVRPPAQMLKDMMEAGGGMAAAIGGAPTATPAAASKPSPKASAVPTKISNDADYAKLPSGAAFIGPDGKRRKKP